MNHEQKEQFFLCVLWGRAVTGEAIQILLKGIVVCD